MDMFWAKYEFHFIVDVHDLDTVRKGLRILSSGAKAFCYLNPTGRQAPCAEVNIN